MHNRLVAISATVALLAAACGGSSDSLSSDTAGPSTDSVADEPLVTEAAAEPSSDAAIEDSVPPESGEDSVATDPAVTEPAVTEPAVTEPAVTEPADTEPVETDPAVTEPEPSESTAGDDGPFDGGGDPFAIFDPANIDDAPFCQSYGSVFGVLIGISFAGGFDALDPENAPTAETYEMVAYPTVLDDVAVLESTAPAIMLTAFRPLFERINSAPGYLSAVGFSDGEIATLVAAENIQLDENLDPRLAEAGALLAADLGPFAEVFDSIEGPASPEDEADFEAFFTTTCPMLATAFDDI
jgi:hypothetical protein